MNPKELQPSSIFINEKSIVIPELARTTNDKFWVLPIGKYEEKLLSKMKNIAGIDKGSRDYLIGLIQYINHDIDEKVLEKLYQKNTIPVKDIIKNFGEVLGPFYALQVLQKNVRDKMHNVVFPVRSNYELFDFFIKDGIHYGFSSKALVGGSNPLVPRLFIERLKKIKNTSEFKKYNDEIDVLKALTEGGMFSGVVNAFGIIVKSRKKSKSFHERDIFSTFRKTNFVKDSMLFERNKDALISTLKLSNVKAYNEFLSSFIFYRISVKNKEKHFDLMKKDKGSWRTGFQSVNVVYGMIKYITSITDFDFDGLMKKLFPDLYIIKMGINNKGIPLFKLQTTVDASKLFKLESFKEGKNYQFRSKAAWDRVNDKLGIQL